MKRQMPVVCLGPFYRTWEIEIIYFFYLSFMACQDQFSQFDQSQSWRVNPWEKLPDHLQAELGLFHMTWAGLEPTTVRWRVIQSDKD